LRRSSRIILLFGVFLAVIAFVGIVILSRPTAPPPPAVATTTPTVYAAVDIPLGTRVTKEMVRQDETKNAERSPTAFQSTSLVIGQTIRRSVVKDTQLTAADFAGGGQIANTVETPAGLRSIAVQVDQVTGVGTIIKPGDFVDVIIGITGDKFPVFTVDRSGVISLTDPGTLSKTTVKTIVQGIQVVGILLPPPAVDAQGKPVAASGTTSLTPGQQELVILAVTPQEAEVIKFAQMDGAITLVLRSPLDFVDASGQRIQPKDDATTGIVLKTMVDQHGVLVPQIVQTILPRVP
jgi:pilus assembly protein CpaB